MPTYEYECSKCNKRFEVIQKMSDPELRVHRDIYFLLDSEPEKIETCNGKVSRLISGGVGVIFKGTGWTRKFHSGSGKTQRKVDDALKQLGIPDESKGYEVKDD